MLFPSVQRSLLWYRWRCLVHFEWNGATLAIDFSPLYLISLADVICFALKGRFYPVALHR
jgi:hypothetical protein